MCRPEKVSSVRRPVVLYYTRVRRLPTLFAYEYYYSSSYSSTPSIHTEKQGGGRNVAYHTTVHLLKRYALLKDTKDTYNTMSIDRYRHQQHQQPIYLNDM